MHRVYISRFTRSNFLVLLKKYPKPKKRVFEITVFLNPSYDLVHRTVYIPNSLLMIIFLQVERKRHIGNDIVNIVFIEQSTAPNVDTVLPTMFDPTWIKSQFTRKLMEQYRNESPALRDLFKRLF